MYCIRKIRGFSRYSISTDGEVFDCKKEKYLKQSNNKDGYLFVNLISDKGERKTKLVHRLVAETFILNYSNKETVNHKDENKQNNNVLNLSWCTNIVAREVEQRKLHFGCSDDVKLNELHDLSHEYGRIFYNSSYMTIQGIRHKLEEFKHDFMNTFDGVPCKIFL